MSDFDALRSALVDFEDAIWAAGGAMREWPKFVTVAEGRAAAPPPGTVAATLVAGTTAILALAAVCGVSISLRPDRWAIDSADWCSLMLPQIQREIDRVVEEDGEEIPARLPPPKRAHPRTLQTIVYDYPRWLAVRGRKGDGRSRPAGGPAPVPAPRPQPRVRMPAPH